MLKKEDESFSLSITFLFCYVASHMCLCVCWSESSPRPRMFDLTCLQRISLANPFDEYLSLHIISQSSSHSHFHDDAKTCAREKFFWTLSPPNRRWTESFSFWIPHRARSWCGNGIKGNRWESLFNYRRRLPLLFASNRIIFLQWKCRTERLATVVLTKRQPSHRNRSAERTTSKA